MVHADAPLSELGRLRLARCIVEDGWSVARAAERFQVTRTTATRWAARYRDSGPGGLVDRGPDLSVGRCCVTLYCLPGGLP
jgi:transposase-like protein